MTVLARPRSEPRRAARGRGRPHLLGLGTALPPLSVGQHELAARLASIWGLTGDALARWRRIVAGAGIRTRCGVLPIEEVVTLSTAARMERYEAAAPPLGAAAAAGALGQAGLAAGDVTDLVVVSCTGFWAPGLDVALVERLGLPRTVRRTVVGFMGCYGAITGLRAAVGACRSDPRAVCLVACVELCSLHLRADRGAQNQVASAIFGDGAAAAVVAAPAAARRAGAAALGRPDVGASLLLAEGRDWMTWRITDAGFAMTLDRHVPAALRDSVAAMIGRPPGLLVVHPGGPGILDAVDAGLGLGGGRGLDVSRDVLERHGNMSSATVLFVLAEALRRGYRPPALLVAFGPGLTMESLPLHRPRRTAPARGTGA